MTAINMIVEPRRAFLMVDSALLVDGGAAIARMRTKCETWPQLHMVTACSGKALHGVAMQVVLGDFRQFDDVVDGISGALRDGWECGYFDGPDGPETFRFFFMGWSVRNRRCEGYAISASAEAGHAPFTRISRDLIITPGVPQDVCETAGVLSDKVDPAVSLLALIEAQRNTLYRDRHVIGGSACLTVVDEFGLTQRTPRRWNEDRIGSPIVPVERVTGAAQPAAIDTGRSRLRRDIIARKARKGDATTSLTLKAGGVR